jgi:formylglycine-generating enzyme required for sulfatase activity
MIRRIVSSISIALALALVSPSAQATRCEVALFLPQASRQAPEVRDLETFGQAMSQGMLLRPEQSDLFEVYRKIFFGDPNRSVDATLKTVTDILQKHPELAKPHFREYTIAVVKQVYDTSARLANYLKSQNTNAGQVRSNFFQIEANLGAWKKMLGYEEPEIPANLEKTAKRMYQEQLKARFMRYLYRIISKENRDLVKDEKAEYQPKIKTLFATLKRVMDHMERRRRETKQIRQAMVDLVATVGFNNQATQALLKSKNAIDKIEGLKKVLDERDSMAMDLGFDGHFPELLQALRITGPSLTNGGGTESEILRDLEREVLSGPFQTLPSTQIRVRSLSIQEAPFRSCLGGSDCSSSTYFSKALDPNFNYFTMTDSENQSSGHVTVVLGTAKGEAGNIVQVAFIDKLQNVPNQMIPNFLDAVRQSLAEQGYLLGLPEDVGDHNGLSNMDTIRHFVASQVLTSMAAGRLVGFVPHPNQYKFENTYSRAYSRPNIKIFQPSHLDPSTEIKPGDNYTPHLADAGLNKQNLIQDLLNLRTSTSEQDVLKYIASGQIIGQLEKLGLFSKNEFAGDLAKITNDTSRSFQVRKAAFIETLLLESSKDTIPDFQQAHFSENEKTQTISEVKQWSKSSDKRKRRFSDNIANKWFKAARQGNLGMTAALLGLRLIDINQKNQMGFTALHLAVQNRKVAMVQSLLGNHNVNVLEVDAKGFTALDHAAALGHEDLVKLMRETRVELAAIHPRLNVHQNMSFLRVEPGSFKMGDDGIAVNISKPFEIMDHLVTQKMYLALMGETPSKFKDGDNSVVMKAQGKELTLQPDNPVEQASYQDGERLLRKINELSQKGDPILNQLIPGHKLGDHYDFITEAQMEYVMKKAKTEDGDTIDQMIQRNDTEKLKSYAVYYDNADGSTQPVGCKKPLFVDDKPIFDINGNVWVWVKDWYQSKLAGGKDPQGPSAGSLRVFRGGSWFNDAGYLRSALRDYYAPADRLNGLGLRFVRTAKPNP